jgi:peptide-methionine (S)-S-oxide reductase
MNTDVSKIRKQLAALGTGVLIMMTVGRADSATLEKATFGAGCFWGVESAFRRTEGVISTQVGYTGGHTENPTYREVCSDQTGHAEAVEVTYDPSQVSYKELLDVFWHCHNPTQGYRQGPDTGSQYRSVIFFQSPQQQQTAQQSKEQLAESETYRNPITTEIVPVATFWRAEEYHQQFHEKKGLGGCRF